MSTEAQKRAWKRYNRKRQEKAYALKMSKINDADIINKLDSVANRQAYIRDLIRQDIKETGNA